MIRVTVVFLLFEKFLRLNERGKLNWIPINIKYKCRGIENEKSRRILLFFFFTFFINRTRIEEDLLHQSFAHHTHTDRFFFFQSSHIGVRPSLTFYTCASSSRRLTRAAFSKPNQSFDFTDHCQRPRRPRLSLQQETTLLPRFIVIGTRNCFPTHRLRGCI